MTVGLYRLLSFAVIILISFGILKLISYFTKGKVRADFFAAVNVFLYLTLVANFISLFYFQINFIWINILVTITILLLNKRSYGRWI